MHEYTIAYDIYATARRAALDNRATEVKKVYVDVGEMSMVNPEQVVFLFGTFGEEDHLFAGTVLECRNVPAETRCDCGYEGTERYVCPVCGKLPQITRGMEIRVTNIEIEVDEA
ncbi:MAG: hydrogenase maturation nickel metallochaperone HypA [Methanomicrobiaceae archaeon]|nr:hydrogenase maturation nickel metallochaperone HypA [Methanomicrobiaceae archaeon]